MNEGMSNVSVFVKKSLMEYRRLGMNLHQWRRLGGVAFILCAAIGVGGYYLSGLYGQAESLRMNYLWAVAASGLLMAGIYGITDIGYKQRYLQTGLEHLLSNTGVPRNYHVEDQQAFRPEAQAQAGTSSQTAAISAKDGPGPFTSVRKSKSLSKRKREKAAQTQAQKEKRELKENLTRFKEGVSETAAADGEQDRSTQIIKQMDPGEQERIIREVLKEFLS